MSDKHPPAGSAYRRKLADPRWQRVAAKIKIHDVWKCQMCGNGLLNGVPLEVHHLRYTALDPWDEPQENLETRCANCHGANPPEAIDPEEYRARLALWVEKFARLNRESVGLLEEAEALGLARSASAEDAPSSSHDPFIKWLSADEWICGCGDHHKADDADCMGCEDQRPGSRPSEPAGRP